MSPTLATTTLPQIDICPFLTPPSPSPSPSSPSNPTPTPTPTPAQQTTAHALHAACTTHGFFYLTGHGIPATLTADILSLARTFFLTIPLAQKALIARRDPPAGDGARGYQVVGENVTLGRRDWHEGVDWYRPVSGCGAENEGEAGTGTGKEGKEKGGYDYLQGPNLWPHDPPTFRAVYEDYVERMLDLGTAVVRAMGLALGLDDPEFFVRETRRSFWVMRAIGYPPLPPVADLPSSSSPPSPSSPSSRPSHSDADADADPDPDPLKGGISCGAHTDYGCLTLLLADATRGALQVQTQAGGWIDADPVPGAFVVNVGDMMERWTNGVWRSTRHRVVHRGQGYRVSVPFFFEPDWEARVRPLRECVAACGGVERCGEVRYGEFLVGKVRQNFGRGGGGG